MEKKQILLSVVIFLIVAFGILFFVSSTSAKTSPLLPNLYIHYMMKHVAGGQNGIYNVTVDALVANNGQANAPSSYTLIAVKKVIWDNETYSPEYVYTIQLPVMFMAYVSARFQLPRGDYAAFSSADARHGIDESNEYNNEYNFTFSVP